MNLLEDLRDRRVCAQDYLEDLDRAIACLLGQEAEDNEVKPAPASAPVRKAPEAKPKRAAGKVRAAPAKREKPARPRASMPAGMICREAIEAIGQPFTAGDVRDWIASRHRGAGDMAGPVSSFLSNNLRGGRLVDAGKRDGRKLYQMSATWGTGRRAPGSKVAAEYRKFRSELEPARGQ